jgi:hypothetical protein
MDDRVYFTPGDVVELKQEISNKPSMVVKSIDKAEMRTGGEKPLFLGITCFWFTHNMEFQLQRFNTKDLVHCE